MSEPPVDLLLVRLASVIFSPKPAGLERWTIVEDGGEIEIRPLRTFERGREFKQLVSATMELEHRPKVTGGKVVVPSRERARLERAIEGALNIVSVANGCRRWIGSPWPPVVLIPTSDVAKDWLAGQTGLLHGHLQSAALRTHDQVRVGVEVVNQLPDRDDGFALMTEALSVSHATGQFHEFVRLFERAFARPSSRLAEPMSAFLSQRFGYSFDELTKWFNELRDPATHADSRQKVVLEVDVRKVVHRMEQAAYDVLLNKRDWRDPSTTRRELWRPDAGTTSAKGDAYIVQGTTPCTDALLLDEHGAFPMDFKAVIKPKPASWWPQEDPLSSTSEGFEIKVVPSDEA